jgi:2-succinyl-5-enolpyruvyl-6-hydroxy-3-cyclohexene-1-carboxylate synthase
VVLLCTSGTAGANYFPAVIEAQESGVPLLVITADRPPEMRECRSGQTIDQQKLYGSHVNFFHELAVPEASLPLLRYLRQTVAHAFGRTQWPVVGPVHLNAPFRDPLPPVEDGTVAGLKKKIGEDFFAHLAAESTPARPGIVPELPQTKRGLIIAGPAQPSDPDRFALMVELLAHKTGWPVLADSLSPLRSFSAPGRPFITGYDALVRNEKLRRKLRPEFVLCLGGWPISKPLRSWLEQCDAPTWMISESGHNQDALHGRTRTMHATVGQLAEMLPEREADTAYCSDWACAEAVVRAALDKQLAGLEWMFEGKAAWLLSAHLPERTPVFVANSMPVRDLEYFWPANERGQAIYFNRGANGIDGTLATALGVAHGSDRPAVLLTGDLALLHDTNGFLSAPELKGSLTVVLINNNGGGIFGHLPVAQFEPPFERYFATPQQVDFKKLCSAYGGVTHVAVKSWTQLARLVAKLPPRGVRVLEIRTDRKRDAAWRKALFARLAE